MLPIGRPILGPSSGGTPIVLLQAYFQSTAAVVLVDESLFGESAQPKALEQANTIAA
jgi:hypothetical protein